MNKKLLALSTAMLGLALVSCGGKTSSSSTSSSTPSSNTTSTSDSSVSSVSSQPGPVTETMPTLYKKLNDGARVRAYDEEFDEMICDFSSETLTGTLTGDAHQVKKNYLKVSLEHSDTETYPSDEEKSIYKQARKADLSPDGIGFRIRVVKGTLKLDNLVLALRGDDAFKVYPISLADALDQDGEELPELTDEFQDIVISPNMTLEGEEVYENKDGTPSSVKVLDKIIGFHLYAAGEAHAMIEIEEVFGVSGQNKLTYEDFTTPLGVPNDETWWKDSTGFITTKSVEGSASGSYTVQTEGITGYENVVLSLASFSKDLSLAPVTAAGVGTAVAWENLKDDQDAALVDPVNGCYGAYVINLENSGISAEGLLGFQVSYETAMTLNAVFMTNMEEKEAASSFPVLDVEHAVMFDDFSRTQNKLDTSYEASSTNSFVTEAGLNWAYTDDNGAKAITIGNGVAKFDGSTSSADFLKLDEGSKTPVKNKKYLVFSMKLEGENETLNGFRVDLGGPILKYDDWFAAQGLKSSSDLNPYITEDGFTWYVIDLELANATPSDKMVIYYTGNGILSIDAIFYCNEFENPENCISSPFPGEVSGTMDATDSSHKWLSIGKNNGGRYIELKMKGNGELNLASFRIESTGNDPIYANNNMKMYVDGEAIGADYIVPEEEITMVIDLVASGWTDLEAEATLVLGDWAPGYLEISECNMLVVKETKQWAALNGEFPKVLAPTETSPHTYAYLGYITEASKIKITLKGDGVHNLESFRIESDQNSEVCYANASLKMSVDGEAIDWKYVVPAEETVITIDLEASGFTVFTANLNFVYGDWGDFGTLEVISAEQYYETMTPEVIINSLIQK